MAKEIVLDLGNYYGDLTLDVREGQRTLSLWSHSSEDTKPISKELWDLLVEEIGIQEPTVWGENT